MTQIEGKLQKDIKVEIDEDRDTIKECNMNVTDGETHH